MCASGEECELRDENTKQSSKPDRKTEDSKDHELEGPMMGIEITSRWQREERGDAMKLVSETDGKPDDNGCRNKSALADHRFHRAVI